MTYPILLSLSCCFDQTSLFINLYKYFIDIYLSLQLIFFNPFRQGWNKVLKSGGDQTFFSTASHFLRLLPQVMGAWGGGATNEIVHNFLTLSGFPMLGEIHVMITFTLTEYVQLRKS